MRLRRRRATLMTLTKCLCFVSKFEEIFRNKTRILYNNAYNFPGLALPPRAAILAHRQPCRHKRFSSVLNPSFRSPTLAGSRGDKKTARTSKDERRGNDSRRRGFPRLHGHESRYTLVTVCPAFMIITRTSVPCQGVSSIFFLFREYGK